MPKMPVGAVEIEIAPEEEEFIAFVREHFDPSNYLEEYTDVAKAGVEPLRHWLNHGLQERRRISRYVEMRWCRPERGWNLVARSPVT
jgi:hypothetical protein